MHEDLRPILRILNAGHGTQEVVKMIDPISYLIVVVVVGYVFRHQTQVVMFT